MSARVVRLTGFAHPSYLANYVVKHLRRQNGVTPVELCKQVSVDGVHRTAVAASSRRMIPLPAFLIVQIRFRADPAAFAPYRDAVGPLAERFGGRYVVAGKAKVEALEGTHDGRSLVVFEFPSMERLHAFWNSPDYAEVKKLREGVADLDVWAVPGFEPAPG